MNIGYVGLGALGAELARRFLPGNTLRVWDLGHAARAKFEGSEAEVSSSAAALARDSDVVLLCLPRSADVRQLLFGEGGLAQGLSPGKLVIDQTSGVPAETAAIASELALHGVAMVDAAVSASPLTVHTGAATLMVAGPAEVVDRALPVLHAITSTIMHCGGRVGDGQAVKLVNNAINAATRLGTLEIAALGRKAGYSLSSICATLNTGAARNQTTDKMLPALARGEASTNFALSLMLKDLNQAVDLGMSHGAPMPLSGLTRSLLQLGLNTVGEQAWLEDMVGVMESIVRAQIAAESSEAADADPHSLPVLQMALAALCRAVTLECVMAGFKHGLEMDVMCKVLTQSSGWSGAGATLLPTLAGDEPESPALLAPWVDAQRKTAQMSFRCAAPTLMSTAVHGLLEGAAAEFGAQADLARLTELSARSAGVRLHLDRGRQVPVR